MSAAEESPALFKLTGPRNQRRSVFERRQTFLGGQAIGVDGEGTAEAVGRNLEHAGFGGNLPHPPPRFGVVGPPGNFIGEESEENIVLFNRLCASQALAGAVGQTQAGFDPGEQPQHLDIDRVDRDGLLQVVKSAFQFSSEQVRRRASRVGINVCRIKSQCARGKAIRLLGMAEGMCMAGGQTQDLRIFGSVTKRRHQERRRPVSGTDSEGNGHEREPCLAVRRIALKCCLERIG